MEKEMSSAASAERMPPISSRQSGSRTVRFDSLTFETLVRRLSPTLKSIAHRLNGHLSYSDDQDLFQEGLLHLWTRFISGDLSDKTDSYILQGCYYHLRNYIRKTRDRGVLLSLSGGAEDDGPGLEESLVAQDMAPDGDVDGNLQVEEIVESGMSQREKEVLLFSLEGMTTREIGTRLGVSHVSVVKIRNRIKERYVRLNELLPARASS
jgi:RNA polymerase sigma factor (sigma-70 family)